MTSRLVVVALLAGVGLHAVPAPAQSPVVAKRVIECLTIARADLQQIAKGPLTKEDKRLVEHAKYLIAQVMLIGREDRDREVEGMKMAEQAVAELTTVLSHQVGVEEYFGLVDRFLANDPHAEEDVATDWPERRLQPLVRFLQSQAIGLGAPDTPLASVTPKRLLGMVLLETRTTIDFGRWGDTFDPPRDALNLVDPAAMPPRFAERWYLAVAAHLQGQGQLIFAIHHADSAIAAFPRDPALLIAAGSLHELLAMPQLADPAAEPRAKTAARAKVSIEDVALIQARRRDALKLAEQFYRQAIDVQSSSLEARLRLARVLSLSGRSDEALTELGALERSDNRRVRYLASMFTGAIRAAAGQWRDAAAAYRDAAGRYPHCLGAATALSHALSRTGERDEARNTIEQALAEDRRTPCLDPWWQYPLGPLLDRDPLMLELRRAIQ